MRRNTPALVAFGIFATVFGDAAAASPPVCDRAGVNIFDASHLPAGWENLPFAWYKDFSALSPPLVRGEGGARLEYVPILTWQAGRDNFVIRALASAAFLKGDVPHPESMGLADFRDLISLERLEQRIRRDVSRWPHGSLFLVGIEPGYRPNGDARSPEAIVRDAAVLRKTLDAMDRGYRLGLGGISTPRNAFTHDAYGGIYGLEFLDRILELPRSFEFDAFVIHPYPSNPVAPSAEDSAEQIRAMRRLLARHGLRDRELIVGEVGTPFRGVDVAEATAYAGEIVEFMLTAEDPETGNPRDGNRLVQRFSWMLLSPLHRPMPGFSDNPSLDFEISALVDLGGTLTPVGQAFLAALGRCRN